MSRRVGLVLALAASALGAAPAIAQVSVASGSSLYSSATFGSVGSTCAGCHVSPASGSANHQLASNNPARIQLGLDTPGEMQGVFPSPPNADQQLSLALHIGQIKKPIANNGALVTHAGFGKAINLYSLLVANGTGGAPSTSGVSRSAASNGTVSAVSHVSASAATFAYNVTYTPNAGFVGTDSFTYSAVNAGFPAADAISTGTISVTVVGITSAATTSFLAGSAGSYAITTNCSTGCALSGANPYSLSGTLPSGLSFSTATGAISGTPASTTAGSYVLTVGADATIGGVTRTVTRSVTLTVVGVNSSGSAGATQGTPFSYSITTNGTTSGATPYSVTGTLPAGLSLNTSSGAITGTPTLGNDNRTVTIGVLTTLGATSRSLSINTAFAGPPTVTASPTAPSGNVGATYPAVQINATNPPISAYAATGLPPGLSANPTTGQITGTPSASGVFNATLSATNGAGSGSSSPVTFTVLPTVAPVIANPGTVSINQGSAVVGLSITASNPPITSYAASGLPSGLTVNPSTGAITGAATASGSFSVSYSATNVIGTSTVNLTYSVTPTAVPVLTAPSSVAAAVGNAMTPVAITATNPPLLSFGGSGLPPGISVDPSTGAISGTPTAFGTFSATLTASNSAGTGSQSVPFTVVGIDSAGTVGATQGSPFSYAITTNGTTTGANPYNATGLPAGLTVNTTSGAITGTPTLGGSTTVTLSAVTPLGTVSRPLTINTAFAGAPAVTSSPASPGGRVGTALAPVQILATNPPVSSYGATGLPPGLIVNPATGQISGSPTASGVFTATVSATNGAGTGSASVGFAILPNAVPGVTAPAVLTTAQGALYAGSIGATHPPITAYGASGLPPGLVVNVVTGAITGTPTTSGVFVGSLSATNDVGSASVPVSFTILPTSVPVISSPTALSGTAGVAMAPATVVATNPPVTAYGASGLPTGVSIDPSTGRIAGTPAAPGSYNVILSATNNAGIGQANVVFTVGALPPVAGSSTLAVPLNGAGTIDLATVVTGFGISGVSIVTPPARGTATVRGTVATYRPNIDYFGTDSFSYVAFGTGGASSAGTITVTVTGRPDPLRSPAVTGLIGGQAETARRFARTQVTNFQRRLDFLHRPSGSAARSAPPVTGAAPATASTGERPTHGDRMLAAQWSGAFASPASGRPVPESTSESLAASASATRGVAASSAEAALGQFVQAVSRSAGADPNQQAMITGAMDLAANRRLDLAAVAGNLSSPEAGRVGVWAGGSLDFGKRPGDATGGESSFSTTGISAGADRRLGNDLIVGAGIGYARNVSDIGSDGSESVGRGTSFAVYASYQPGDAFFDGLLGFVALEYDNSRFVTGEGAFAKSERSGRQVFATFSSGYAWRTGGFTITPYGRVELSSDRIDGGTETGVGAAALSYGEQSGNTVAAALGLRFASTHPTGFGWVTPRLRLELRHEAERSDATAISYADLPGSPFLLGADRRNRNARVFGVGADFEARSGTRVGVDYLLQSSEELRRGESLMLSIAKEFGGPPVRRSADDVVRKPIGYRVETGITFDDNITRSRDRADRLHDQTTSLSVARGRTIGLSPHSRLWLNGSLAGERSHHFEGLDRLSANGIAELQYRTSGAFDAATFGLSVRLSADDYRSDLRDGVRGTAAVSVQQALTDRIGLFGAVAANRRNARSEVFDIHDRSIRFNLDYLYEDGDTLYAGGEVRRGTVVSVGRATLDNVTMAEVLAPDDAYPTRSFFAYRIDARTVILTLGYNLRLGNRDSIDLSVRRAVSTPSQRPSWAGGDPDYVAHQISAFYLTRF